jgi:hypothetical protein
VALATHEDQDDGIIGFMLNRRERRSRRAGDHSRGHPADSHFGYLHELVSAAVDDGPDAVADVA